MTVEWQQNNRTTDVCAISRIENENKIQTTSCVALWPCIHDNSGRDEVRCDKLLSQYCICNQDFNREFLFCTCDIGQR